MNSQPSCSSTRAMMALGGGAPATTMRTRSRPGIGTPLAARAAAASRIDATTAGAPHISVTPSRSTRRRMSSPSIFLITTCEPPIAVTA